MAAVEAEEIAPTSPLAVTEPLDDTGAVTADGVEEEAVEELEEDILQSGGSGAEESLDRDAAAKPADFVPLDCENSRILATIVDRLAAETFPVVAPAECVGEAASTAGETLSFAQKCETVELQSYLDEQWRLFRSTAIYDDDGSEAVRRAIWSREYYYKHMRSFFQSRDTYDETAFAHVQRLFGQTPVKEEVLQKARQLSARIGSEEERALGLHIERAWENFQTSLPDFARSDNIASKTLWWQNLCIDVLERFLEAPRQPMAYR